MLTNAELMVSKIRPIIAEHVVDNFVAIATLWRVKNTFNLAQLSSCNSKNEVCDKLWKVISMIRYNLLQSLKTFVEWVQSHQKFRKFKVALSQLHCYYGNLLYIRDDYILLANDWEFVWNFYCSITCKQWPSFKV